MQEALNLCIKKGFKQENVEDVGDFKVFVMKKVLADCEELAKGLHPQED
jgi:hypothetical protein